MGRAWAIIERELRRFRRSPVLIAISMVMPLVQLVVLGYAFGGNVKHLKLAIVDQDHGVPAVKVRELAAAVSSGAHTIDTIDHGAPRAALDDLRNRRRDGGAPITKFQLIAGFNISGTIKAVIAGAVLLLVGSLIAGVPDPFNGMRLIRLLTVVIVTAFALISLMFLMMVRVSDPLLPRAVFGVLN